MQANALRDEPNVAGFDTLNEPNAGWVGRLQLDEEELPFRLGLVLSRTALCRACRRHHFVPLTVCCALTGAYTVGIYFSWRRFLPT